MRPGPHVFVVRLLDHRIKALIVVGDLDAAIEIVQRLIAEYSEIADDNLRGSSSVASAA
ncbi:hypothetical protein GCM10009850_120720 [Nonomuraea monospora]|uniref:Uncharacterized protein n=1 Tax=Nonomuraea monospora TaxID=568818 RepID=A0ABN3D4K8_9ACTN